MLGQGAQLPWRLDPLDALQRWPADHRALMLHSGRHHPKWARYTILTSPAGTFRFTGEPGAGRSEWLPETGNGDLSVDAGSFSHRPFADLRQISRGTDGLWVGYLSYDVGRWIERLPDQARRDRGFPVLEFAWCPGSLVHDTAENRWSAHGSWREEPPFALDQLAKRNTPLRTDEPTGDFTRDEYESAIAKVKQYIAAGDVFQVNLAQRFTSQFTGEPRTATRSLFQQLAQVSPAWYGAYLELAEHDGTHRAIASTSPELFLQVNGREVITRPIKGTRPASAQADELRRSEKDTAELNMIVDLMRNDLGRVCDYGSVRVPEPRVIESHPTVHHGVATITGRLHESKDTIDLLRATLPGGSVTGAPKVRAMQIIDELEPVRRGPYCGTIGFFSQDQACFNIAIRTLLVEQAGDSGTVDFSVGGGIVADSDIAGEFDETIDKAQAMLRALRAGSFQQASFRP